MLWESVRFFLLLFSLNEKENARHISCAMRSQSTSFHGLRLIVNHDFTVILEYSGRNLDPLSSSLMHILAIMYYRPVPVETYEAQYKSKFLDIFIVYNCIERVKPHNLLLLVVIRRSTLLFLWVPHVSL
jgi:hypothetical protein